MNDLPTPWAHFADGGAHYEAYGPLTPNTRAARPIRSTHDLRAPLCPSPQGRPSQPVHRAHGATIQNPAAAADFAPAFPAAARPAQTSPPSPIGGNVRTERALQALEGDVSAPVSGSAAGCAASCLSADDEHGRPWECADPEGHTQQAAHRRRSHTLLGSTSTGVAGRLSAHNKPRRIVSPCLHAGVPVFADWARGGVCDLLCAAPGCA